MASAKIAIKPVHDSYNTYPEPLFFEVTDTTVSILVDGTGEHGVRILTFRKAELRMILECSDTYEKIED